MPADHVAYRHRIHVRFRDCDSFGHVNNAVYLTYLEQCRLTFWREATGTPIPYTRVIVARAECDYRAPAHFGDELEVRLRVNAIGRSSFTLDYDIVRLPDEGVVATAKTVMVSYDYETSRAAPLPDVARAFLERIQKPEPE